MKLMAIMTSIQTKLAKLRKDWQKYPHKRDVINLQAKMLQLALKAPTKISTYPKATAKLIDQATQALT